MVSVAEHAAHIEFVGRAIAVNDFHVEHDVRPSDQMRRIVGLAVEGNVVELAKARAWPPATYDFSALEGPVRKALQDWHDGSRVGYHRPERTTF